MKKLFRLKEWLTPEETARRLTTSFQEEISIADCLQLALDKKITISVLLNDSHYFVFSEHPEPQSKMKRIGEVDIIKPGLYDLPMIGNERLMVMNLRSNHDVVFRPEENHLDGIFIINDNKYANILIPRPGLRCPDGNISLKLFSDDGLKLYDRGLGRFIDEDNYMDSFIPAKIFSDFDLVFRRENIEKFESSQLEENLNLSLDESLFVIGAILDALKNSDTKSKRWTQDSLKNEITGRGNAIAPRLLDDYFSNANKHFKTKN